MGFKLNRRGFIARAVGVLAGACGLRLPALSTPAPTEIGADGGFLVPPEFEPYLTRTFCPGSTVVSLHGTEARPFQPMIRARFMSGPTVLAELTDKQVDEIAPFMRDGKRLERWLRERLVSAKSNG